MAKNTPALARKLKALRNGQGLTQKEVAKKAHITESAYRAYELGDRHPKPDAVDRLAKALGVMPEYLSVPQFRNQQEFVYALLEYEDLFGYTASDVGGNAVIASENNPEGNALSDFMQKWEEMRNKRESNQISLQEYEEWKQRWQE